MILLKLFIILGLAHADSFRFHLTGEPANLDFQTSASAGGNYAFQNIYRGLFRYHSEKGLIKEGAKDCSRGHLTLTCTLSPDHKWSNGARVKAGDYVKSFQRLVTPANKSPQVELLITLKNARDILAGKMAPDQLGVKALDDETLRIEFAEDDPEFEFKLINLAVTPWPPTGIQEREKAVDQLTDGPYKFKAWKLGASMELEPNKNYKLPANPKRPSVEVYFLDSDTTALNLYESGKLNFLRRLKAGEIPRYRGSKEFVQRPFARMEYMAFGPQLVDHPHLREALVYALDFDGFLKLFDTKSPVGCPGIPRKFVDKFECLKFDPARAKRALARDKSPPKLSFSFSSQGGEDMNRGAEWFQGQWKKNLGLDVELKGIEQIVYLRVLRNDAPPIFRKGVGLDRPTCLAAMELFTKDHPENYIHFDDPKYEKLVKDLKAQTTDRGRRVACRKASDYLIGTHRILPLGEMFFTMLASQKFSGWDLNELNHLDLTDLAEK